MLLAPKRMKTFQNCILNSQTLFTALPRARAFTVKVYRVGGWYARYSTTSKFTFKCSFWWNSNATYVNLSVYGINLMYTIGIDRSVVEETALRYYRKYPAHRWSLKILISINVAVIDLYYSIGKWHCAFRNTNLKTPWISLPDAIVTAMSGSDPEKWGKQNV